MLRSIIVGVGVLLASSPAWAVDHWQRCKDAFEAGTAEATDPLPLDPSQAESWCFDTNAVAEGNLVDGRACEYVDVKVHCDDADGGACVAANVAVTWFVCGRASKTSCATTASGITGIDHQPTTWPNSFSMQYGYPDVVTNTNGDDLRVEVKCYAGERQEP